MTDDLHSLAAAYVLDALDDDERAAFEAHLADCAECTVDVEDLRAAAALLAASEPPVAPPVDLKARVMAEIAGTAQASPMPPTAPSNIAPVAPTALRRENVDVPAGRGPSTWITLVAAAVVVVLLGFGAVLAFGNGDPAPDPTELAIAELQEAPDTVTVDLQGDAPGTVQVMYSAEQQRAMVVGEGLDAPSDDQVYQLWTISGEVPTPSVVFSPVDGELGEEMDMDFAPPEAWAITVEPSGGSPAPTGDIVFQGTPA